MSASSLAKIQAQIEKLQKQAEAIRAKEVAEVIARIKDAVEHYAITAEDLGLSGRKPRTAKAPKSARVSATKKLRKTAAPKKKSVIKYRDDAGHTWTGHGKRPGWFKAALEGGKKAEDLLVKAPK